MHRATPANTSIRSYSAGGARSVVDSVDDKKLMQESSGSISKGEKRGKIEAPQNYGFSSVTADADKEEQGGPGGAKGGMGAEAFISFMGGNRSFPVASVIDDRRHRLKDIAKGDVAMFGQREWGQQFHVNKTGMWMSGNVDRKIKLQLVENNTDDQQQQSEGSSSGGGQQQQQEQKGGKAQGQKQLYDKESSDFIEITANKITIKRGDAHVELDGSSVVGYFGDKKKSFRADTKHTHIRHQDNIIWVDEKGCWSSKPIETKSCTDA